MATKMGTKRNGVGIDIVDVSRFSKLYKKPHTHSLNKLFLKSEIQYCLSYKEPATHLAGIFAAKEAVSKALGVGRYPFIELEIRHAKDGSPEAWSKNKRLPVSISIAHTLSLATAIAIA